jgi:pro-apoptotic serine protease NMA111
MRPQLDNGAKGSNSSATLPQPQAHTNGADYGMHNGESSGDGDGAESTLTGGGIIDVDELKPLSRVPTTAEPPEWQATIEKVVKNVVAIHFCQTCSFDTDPAMSSEATGFVVDAEKGYILTNRHVVGSGPFWGHCIFDNHEEVSYLSESDGFFKDI